MKVAVMKTCTAGGDAGSPSKSSGAACGVTGSSIT